MARVTPFDPTAVAQLTALAVATCDRVSALLQRKADRAAGLREVAADAGDERAFKNAESLDREVLLIVELIQDYKRLIAQHEADNTSAWAMIELQDKRCASLKRSADFWQAEHAEQTRQLQALTAAWAADLQRRMAA
jgi:hypothetical protein